MKILCSDLEGTLAPEIWQEISNEFDIPELRYTTREISDFDELMDTRMRALKSNTISFKEIKNFVKTIKPFEGAKNFLSSLKEKYQIVIVSDTFYELALPVVDKLGGYPILCHHLDIKNNYISSDKQRQDLPKKQVVKGFASMNFECFCIGDSHNDIQMIEESEGALIFAPEEIKSSYPDIMSFTNYRDLQDFLLK